MTLILSIDQGTTGSQAALFEVPGFRMLANAKVEFPQNFPKPGWVEHNPNDIWQSVNQAIDLVLKELSQKAPQFSAKSIAAIGITNQRESVLAWNRATGELAGNAIVWQDRRTEAFCRKLKSDPKTAREINQKTGLVIDPYFSASKMNWMLENYALALEWGRKGKLCLGTIDSYIIYRLSAGQSFVTDCTNASRTQLYNLKSGAYDDELMQLFKVPSFALPEIRPCSSIFGKTQGMSNLPDGIPISGCLGDQQAALFGQRCTEAGEGKITYGTGAFILLACGEELMTSEDGLLTTVAYSDSKTRSFAFEGSAFIAGAAVQFLRDNFAWFKNAADCQALALSEARDPNLIFIPALTGFGAPYWNPNAKGALMGLSRGSSRAQISRAVLESIALQNVQLLKIMEAKSGKKIKKIGVDGGASANDFLMQFQADTLRVKLVRPENVQTTAKGAAFAAFFGINPGAKLELAENSSEFLPQMEELEAGRIVSLWTKASQALNNFYC